jgi:hypothetical protein
MISRRRFLSVAVASAMTPAVRPHGRQSGEWDTPVFDFHFHLRGRGSDKYGAS